MTISRDIRLNLSADLANYQKAMAKLPNLTEKEASKAALKLQIELIRAEGKAAAAAAKAGQQAAKGFAGAFSGITLAITVTDIKQALTSVTDLAQRTADLRNQLTDTEARTGIAAETIGGLRLAFDGAGVGADKLDSALNPLPKRLDDARRGTGEAVLALERLGITQSDLNGDLKSNDAAFKAIVERLQAVEDPADRAAIATGAFGEAGGFLVQSLGTAELQAFVDQAERFGVGVGPEATASASQLQRAMADLRLVVQGAGAAIADSLDVGQKIDNFVVGFVFAQAAIADVAHNIVGNLTLISELITGDLTAGTQEFDKRFRELGIKTFGEVQASAEAVAADFLATRREMREGAATAEELAASMAETSGQHRTAAQATSDYAKAQREAEKAERDRIKALEDQFKAVDKLVTAGNKSAESFLDDRQKIDASLAAEIARLEELRMAAGDTFGAQEAFERAATNARRAAALERAKIDLEDAQAAQEVLDAKVNANIEANEAIKESDKELAEARADFALEAIATLQQFADIAAQITQERVAQTQEALDASVMQQQADVEALQAQREGASAAEIASINQRIKLRRAAGRSERGELEETLGRRKRAASVAFAATQAAALAEVAVRTALNTVALMAPPPAGLGPIAGPPFALAAGAVGAAAILAQKPPKFHDGTGRDGARMGPDEFAATLRVGEGVASTQAMQVKGFPELLQAVNRLGDAGMPRQQVVRAVIEQRQLSQAMLDEAAGDGALGSLLVDRAPGAAPGLV